MQQLCPVCEWKWIVPQWFYNWVRWRYSSTSTIPDTCRRCNWVWTISTWESDWVYEEPDTDKMCSKCHSVWNWGIGESNYICPDCMPRI